MLRLLITTALIGFAPCAMAATMPTAGILAQWQSLRDPDAPAVAFSDGYRFLSEYPGWPDEKTIRMRTEGAALFEHPDRSAMQRFCKDLPPISGRGMIACADAQAGDDQQRKDWLRQGWIQGDFSESEEKAILADHSKDFTSADHLNRMMRLLYEERLNPAKRQLERIPTIKHVYLKAWMGLIQNDKKTKNVWRNLTKAQQSSPGILFARINNALAARDLDTVVQLVKQVPASAPYPDLWWPARNIAIREAISEGNYNTALSILSDHGDLKPEALSEALWLKGWITLEYKNNAGEAYKDFHKLYTEVSTPVSRARAAYWAGRAATKNGNPDIAREWYGKAAENQTVFYGQLAHLKLKPNDPLGLPSTTDSSSDQRQSFENDALVAATRQFAADQDTVMRDKFLAHMANTSDSPARLTLVAKLANELGGMSSGVKVAKLALRKRVVMMEAGWPRIDLPSQLGVEPALALAITRQESEFDPYARSSANARGLMQLLPATAKHVAKTHDISYNDRSLENPKENLVLGSTYLGQIIDGFNGSYVLGIASYNAGPANARRWVQTFGMPPKTVEGTVNWIESIPFSETRNYVMRVLENVQIYRTQLNPDTAPQLAQDLTR